MKSWLEFEDRFRRIAQPLRYLRLDFQWGSAGEYWRVCGDQASPLSRQFEVLAELAGSALAECAETYPELQSIVEAETTPAHRWFRALKELTGEFRYEMPGRELDENDQPLGLIHFGSLASVVDVSANLSLLLHARYPMKEKGPEPNGITISNSTIGVLNSGELQNVGSISVNVSSLAAGGQNQIADALCQLAEAVASSESLESEARAEVLDQLEELSRQATLDPSARSKGAVLKSIISGIGSVIGMAGGLAEVWSTWGPQLRSYFGIG